MAPIEITLAVFVVLWGVCMSWAIIERGYRKYLIAYHENRCSHMNEERKTGYACARKIATWLDGKSRESAMRMIETSEEFWKPYDVWQAEREARRATSIEKGDSEP